MLPGTLNRYGPRHHRHVLDEGGDPFGQVLIVLALGVRQRIEDLPPGIERLLTAEPEWLAALPLRPLLSESPLLPGLGAPELVPVAILAPARLPRRFGLDAPAAQPLGEGPRASGVGQPSSG